MRFKLPLIILLLIFSKLRNYNLYYVPGYPEPPLNVTVVPVANGARVEWTKNFNGGFKQSFYVEYREQGNKRWEKVKTLPITVNNRMFWTIGNLHEDGSYSFRMFSRNKIGDSNKTEEFDLKIFSKMLCICLFS